MIVIIPQIGPSSRRALEFLGVAAFAILLFYRPARAAEDVDPAPSEVFLPSAEPSGIPNNDRIPVVIYPSAFPGRQPAVVLLHPLGSDETQPLMVKAAQYLAHRGITCALMALAYHGRRTPPGEMAGRRFTDDDVTREVQAYRQSASDVSTVLDYLIRQPNVDPDRLGILGVSLGAIVTHIAMGLDTRLKAGVAILGGGNLADLRRSSLVPRVQHHSYVGRNDPFAEQQLRQIDPISFADRNRPRHVLMIEAARDLLVLPRDAEELWNALGRPPIQWVDTNHFALGIAPGSVFRAAYAYLRSIWDGVKGPIPRVQAFTLKTGFLIEPGYIVSPAVQWQALTLGTRPDHLSLFHGDLGLDFRGPFLGVGVTLNQFIDLGVARHIQSHVAPYLSLHVVF